MGEPTTMTIYFFPTRRPLSRLPTGLVRSRPRGYAEWKALRRWGKLPSWEVEPPGYLLRLAREEAKLTQRELAERVGCSQQAVAQAERWRSNPTLELMRRWAAACGARLKIDVRVPRRKPVMRHSREG